LIGEVRILWRKHDYSTAAPITPHGEFAVEQRQHDAVVGRRDGTAIGIAMGERGMRCASASRENALEA